MAGSKRDLRRNRHSLRHGLTAAKMPEGTEYIQIRCDKLRRTLEDFVIEQHGEISLGHASAINTAVKWERHGALAARWLRIREEELTPSDLLKFSKEVASASTHRDKAIDSLSLSGDTVDETLTILYGKKE